MHLAESDTKLTFQQRMEYIIWWLKTYLVFCWPWKQTFIKVWQNSNIIDLFLDLQTSGADDKIPYGRLKKLIERLYNNRTNLINIRPVGAKW